MVSVSQWEREAIGERTRDAMRHKRACGERVGTVPFGYRVASDGLHLEVEPGEHDGHLGAAIELDKAHKVVESLRSLGQLFEKIKSRNAVSKQPAQSPAESANADKNVEQSKIAMPAQTPEVLRETKPNPETTAAFTSKSPADTEGGKGLKSTPLESETGEPSGAPVPTATASNIDKTRGIDPTAEDEDWVAADRAVEKHLEVSVRTAARWLRCTVKHVLRLSREGALTGSKTRPKRITTKSLREYKWSQGKPNASENN